MPIATTDLLLQGAASRPTDDVTTSGGARDAANKPEFTQLTANSVIAVVSDGADTRTATVTGRNAAGAIVSEALVLNGTTEVVGATTFERIQRVVLSASDGTRAVTVRQGAGGATRATLGPNRTSVSMLFQNAASEAGAVNRYEKVFWLNNHGSLTLNTAAVRLTADPATRIRIGLAASKNDSATVANRLAAPGGITFVDDNVSQSVPGTTLEAASAIGVWVAQELLAADSPIRNTYTLELSGTSV
jgi:hypothetical protein